MNCIIIEDQPPAQRILKKYIEDVGSLELKGTFSDAIQALEFLRSEKVDVIFLDIHLPKLSGIDFLKTIPYSPHVILTTAFPDYALESYEFSVVDYLLKPFSFQRFVKALSKIKGQEHSTTIDRSNPVEQHPPKKEIFIKSGYEYIKVAINDIVHITSDTDYTELKTEGKKYLSNESLRYWLEALPEDQFCRIHKSHIVNLKKIEKVIGNQIYLTQGIKLPIGRAYKEDFMNTIID